MNIKHKNWERQRLGWKEAETDAQEWRQRTDALFEIFGPVMSDQASLVDQRVKNLPATLETWVWSWVRKIPWRREWQPTPVFLLENSMDRGAWWSRVHEVAKSRTQMKQLSTMWEVSDKTDFLVMWNNKSPFPSLSSFFPCYVSLADFTWIAVSSDHELLIAKFRHKLKKVGKTTRYDLNQIP